MNGKFRNISLETLLVPIQFILICFKFVHLISGYINNLKNKVSIENAKKKSAPNWSFLGLPKNALNCVVISKMIEILTVLSQIENLIYLNKLIN